MPPPLTKLLESTSKGRYNPDKTVEMAKTTICYNTPAKSLDFGHTPHLIRKLDSEIKRLMNKRNSPILTIPIWKNGDRVIYVLPWSILPNMSSTRMKHSIHISRRRFMKENTTTLPLRMLQKTCAINLYNRKVEQAIQEVILTFSVKSPYIWTSVYDTLFIMRFSQYSHIWNTFLQFIHKISIYTWLLIVSFSYSFVKVKLIHII